MSFDAACKWKAQSCRFAIRLLISLIGGDGENSRIAKEYNLLLCLATFAVSRSDDTELKQAALEKVVLLSPFL
jgi:hypothetical protein